MGFILKLDRKIAPPEKIRQKKDDECKKTGDECKKIQKKG
jgi:hypothetical protein